MCITKIIIKKHRSFDFSLLRRFFKNAHARKALSADKARLVPTIPLA